MYYPSQEEQFKKNGLYSHLKMTARYVIFNNNIPYNVSIYIFG